MPATIVVVESVNVSHESKWWSRVQVPATRASGGRECKRQPQEQAVVESASDKNESCDRECKYQPPREWWSSASTSHEICGRVQVSVSATRVVVESAGASHESEWWSRVQVPATRVVVECKCQSREWWSGVPVTTTSRVQFARYYNSGRECNFVIHESGGGE